MSDRDCRIQQKPSLPSSPDRCLQQEGHCGLCCSSPSFTSSIHGPTACRAPHCCAPWGWPRLTPPRHRHCGCWLCPAQPSAEGQPGRAPCPAWQGSEKGKAPAAVCTQQGTRSRPQEDATAGTARGQLQRGAAPERAPKETCSGLSPSFQQPPRPALPVPRTQPQVEPGWQRGLPQATRGCRGCAGHGGCSARAQPSPGLQWRDAARVLQGSSASSPACCPPPLTRAGSKISCSAGLR